jgi:hypothetical protein
MQQLLRNRWVQTGALTVVAVVVTAVISFLIFGGGAGDTSAGLFFATGGTTATGEGGGLIGAPNVHLPATAAEAVAVGWKETASCTSERGRYFQHDAPGENDSYLLVYDLDDQVIGVYLYSMAELPAPWQHMDQLLGEGGTAPLDFEHWGIFVYIQDPIGACIGTPI